VFRSAPTEAEDEGEQEGRPRPRRLDRGRAPADLDNLDPGPAEAGDQGREDERGPVLA
jgi:hypothetical protein